MRTLCEVEDPYYYFDRLTMPKLVVNAVGDEFQQPDDNHYWWADLPEPKRFLMVPNAEHSLATGILEVVPVIGTWMAALLKGRAIPQFTWSISETNGDIHVALDPNVMQL
jgi:PhoPQ-activated pathogenicity-related protein